MTDAEINLSIRGATEVIAHYGHWPSFHDADLIKIDIDMRGPTVTIEFRLYDWNQAIGRSKRPRLVMVWQQVDRINFSGIDEIGQNAISSLRLSQVCVEGHMWIDTRLLSTGTGTDAQIRATSVQITCFDLDEYWEHENIDSWQAVSH